MSARRRATVGHGEHGATLVLILVFITTMGVLTAALASLQTSVTRQSFAVRRVQARESAANSGVEWAINSIRQGRDAMCHGPDRDAVLALGGREVEVSCRPVDDDGVARSGMALYLNRSGDEAANVVRTKGSFGEEVPVIAGPVYNARGQDGWQLDGFLRIDGDVVSPDGEGSCLPGRTTELPKYVLAAYDNARACTMDLTAVQPPRIPQPCADRSMCTNPEPLPLDAKGNETKLVAACHVFSPGYYTKPPRLAMANHFRPGVYSFEFGGEWAVSSSIRGGDPAPPDRSSVGDQVRTTMPRCVGAPEPEEPYGVVIVLGSSTTVQLRGMGRLELFAMTADGARLPSVVVGGQKGITEWAPPSEPGLERDLLTNTDGSAELVLHSGLYAPDSGVTLRTRGDTIGSIRGTAVLARMDLVAESQPKYPDSFGIVGRTGLLTRYVVMASSCPGSTGTVTRDACSTPPPGPVEPELCASATVTVFDDDRRTVYVDSWRVDRDPSPADPARCELGTDAVVPVVKTIEPIRLPPLVPSAQVEAAGAEQVQ